MKNEKRGQAFLISAIVIMGVLVGLLTLPNFSRTSGFSTLKYEGERIEVESINLMDYALVNKLSSEDINETALNDFMKKTSKKLGANTNITFMFYSEGEWTCYLWQNGIEKTCSAKGNNLELEDIEYNFKNPPNSKSQKLEFLIIREKGDERHVYQSGQ